MRFEDLDGKSRLSFNISLQVKVMEESSCKTSIRFAAVFCVNVVGRRVLVYTKLDVITHYLIAHLHVSLHQQRIFTRISKVKSLKISQTKKKIE